MPVPWQNITTLVSLSSRVGGSPKGPRAVILQERFGYQRLDYLEPTVQSRTCLDIIP